MNYDLLGLLWNLVYISTCVLPWFTNISTYKRGHKIGSVIMWSLASYLMQIHHVTPNVTYLASQALLSAVEKFSSGSGGFLLKHQN